MGCPLPFFTFWRFRCQGFGFCISTYKFFKTNTICHMWKKLHYKDSHFLKKKHENIQWQKKFCFELFCIKLNNLFSDPLRTLSNTDLQNLALTRFGNTSATPMPEFQNVNNIPFPYLENVKAIINVEDCINSDYNLLVKDGRR